jgi:hypothetical protein
MLRFRKPLINAYSASRDILGHLDLSWAGSLIITVLFPLNTAILYAGF